VEGLSNHVAVRDPLNRQVMWLLKLAHAVCIRGV